MTANPSYPGTTHEPATGPPVRRRRRLRRMGIAATAVALTLAVAGATYQEVATRVDSRRYPPPGRLVDVGGYRLHLFCTGAGAPTVVLAAMFPGTVSNWAWVQPELAATTRVCAYDRAGLGWSDRGPTPRDARSEAAELHTLLHRGGVPGPYLLVGHSWGGLTVRLFADRHPDEVAGLGLIEATNPDAWKRRGLPEGVGVSYGMLTVAPLLGRLGLFRLGVLPGYSTDPDLPPRQRHELQAFLATVKALQTIRDVDASFSASLEQARHTHGIGDKPLLIVLGADGDGADPALHDLFAGQEALSRNALTELVPGATHAGLVDHQDHAAVTAAALLRLVAAVRAGTRLRETTP